MVINFCYNAPSVTFLMQARINDKGANKVHNEAGNHSCVLVYTNFHCLYFGSDFTEICCMFKCFFVVHWHVMCKRPNKARHLQNGTLLVFFANFAKSFHVFLGASCGETA